ncbi:MAG: HYR domain-containing protein [Saprospiraceae bacterium]|nr:HYR domain-containing protein [Saprospiraceae bacterium]
MSCPADILVYLKGGECRETVCYWPILATDNCAVTDTTYSIEPCTYFEIGTTPVTIYVYDAAGNVDSCSFNVIVLEYIPNGNTLTCNDHLNLSLDQNCQAEITPDMLFEGGEYRCYEDYIVTSKDATGNIFGYFTICLYRTRRQNIDVFCVRSGLQEIVVGEQFLLRQRQFHL